LLLEAGADVLGIARRRVRPLTDLYDPGRAVAVEAADVTDAPRLQALLKAFRPEIVIHTAAAALAEPTLKQPRTTFLTNVIGTVNVLDAAVRLNQAPAVVVVSSSRSPGDHDYNPYNASKEAAEIVVRSYVDSIVPAGGRSSAVVLVRPGVLIGGGDWSSGRLVPAVVRALAANAPPRLRQPAALRPWLHVLDVAAGCLWLAVQLRQRGALPQLAYNLGRSQASEAETVGEIAGLLSGYWSGRDNPRTHRHLPTGGFSLDCRHARDDVGWWPAWNTRRAVSETARWYRTFYACHDQVLDVTREQVAAVIESARQQRIPWAKGVEVHGAKSA
jgi:CDP-glucose 4,6-dehydratase